MKKVLNKTLCLLAIMLAFLGKSVTVSAYDFKALNEDGVTVYYDVNGNNATVTSGDEKYSGKLRIPATVTHNGQDLDVTSIGEYAFASCRDLESIVLPAGITSIEDYAFSYCSKLVSVGMPSNVLVIGNYAFMSCGNLESVILPEGLETIGAGTFSFCEKLTSIEIPSSTKSIGISAFAGTTALASIMMSSGNMTYDSREDCNAIIETSTNTLVAGCKATRVPESVTAIGKYAFASCRDLESIVLPAGITSIEDNAFNYCSKLVSVDIPSNVLVIGNYAFMGCGNLESVILPEGLETIGAGTFSFCEKLTSIEIPSSTKSIGISAFAGTTALASIMMSSGNMTYDSREDCNAIIETSTNTLVAGCKATRVPESVTAIGKYAFASCRDLESIVLPAGITSIEDNAFNYCSKLVSVDIQSNVLVIGNYAFMSCRNLESVLLPEGLETIGTGAFSNCEKLSSINSLIITPFEIESNVFDESTKKSATLFVPKGTKDAYIATAGWDFANIEENSPTKVKAYALWCEGNKTMYFLSSTGDIKAGQLHDGQTITNVWGGTDVTKSSKPTPAWYGNVNNTAEKVVFEESFREARPASTHAWFAGCTNLSSIEGIGNLNTTETTTMQAMFGYCQKLTKIDVTGFNTGNVTNMKAMFAYCSDLESLNLSSFQAVSVEKTDSMFLGCGKLERIFVSDKWNTQSLKSSNNMFMGCPQLVGGLGTEYDPLHVDATYAHVDAEDSPGYLTDAADIGKPVMVKLTVVCSEGGCLVYEGQQIANGERTFLVPRGSDVTVTCIPDDGYVADHPVFNVQLGSSVGFNSAITECYIYHMNSSAGIKVVFVPEDLNQDAKAYALWCEGNKTMYFLSSTGDIKAGQQHDGQTITNVWGGTDVTKSSKPTPAWYGTVNNTAEKVVFEESFREARPASTHAWFAGCTNLSSIEGIGNLNTTETTTMQAMFGYCQKLTKIDVTGFNTGNVTNMKAMFAYCSDLESLNLSSFQAVSVEKTDSMFLGCGKLERIFVSDKWNTQSLKSSNNMFMGCPQLVGGLGTEYDPLHVDATYAHVDAEDSPGYLTDAADIGKPVMVKLTVVCSEGGCLVYEGQQIANGERTFLVPRGSDVTVTCIPDDGYVADHPVFNVQLGSSVGFNSAITECYIYHMNSSAGIKVVFVPEDLNQEAKAYALWCEGNKTMYFLSSTGDIKAGQLHDGQTITNVWDGTDVTESSMPTPAWNESVRDNLVRVVFEDSFKDVKPTSTRAWFRSCENLSIIEGMEYLNTTEVTTMRVMFSYCPKIEDIDVSHFNTSKVTDMGGMFVGCSSLKSIDLSNFDTSMVTDMLAMFRGDEKIESLDLSSFNTENVTSMQQMFYDCKNLTDLKINSFNTSNVTDLGWMFFDCYGLTHLDLSHFVTDKVTSMRALFGNCVQLKEVNLKNWNTGNVTSMRSMFYYCRQLEGVDVSNFDTHNVTSMRHMFNYCSKIKDIDLCSFDTRKVEEMDSMFYRCGSLKTIVVNAGTWSTESVTSSENMFYQCSNIIGEIGTYYNSSNVDAKYAHIDEEGNPGYLTGGCSVKSVLAEKEDTSDTWYTLNGIRLQEAPVKKGLYLRNGKKFTIK